MKPLRSLALPAGLLALAQVWHAVTPANNLDRATGAPVEGGYVGLFGGLLLLIGCIVAVFAARQDKPWARPLSFVCGVGVAGGFILYHTTTLQSPVTNPYLGVDGIGIVQWLPVFACIALGAWLAWTAWPLSEKAATAA